MQQLDDGRKYVLSHFAPRLDVLQRITDVLKSTLAARAVFVYLLGVSAVRSRLRHS